MKIKLIGIAGPSGAGKSTITKIIEQENPNLLRVKLDNYFNNIEGFPKIDSEPIWDVPSNINFNLLYKNLLELREGKKTELPYFDKVTFKRISRETESRPIILVEGFLLYFDERIRNLFDVKLYVDISDELMLERRLKRETLDRNKYIRDVVIPNYKIYGLPAKRYADFVIDGSVPTAELKVEIMKVLSEWKTNQEF